VAASGAEHTCTIEPEVTESPSPLRKAGHPHLRGMASPIIAEPFPKLFVIINLAHSRRFRLLLAPTHAMNGAVRRDRMDHDPYYTFPQSPERHRQVGARGGRAYARNRRARLCALGLLGARFWASSKDGFEYSHFLPTGVKSDAGEKSAKVLLLACCTRRARTSALSGPASSVLTAARNTGNPTPASPE
jgi:hypothetical protein